MGAEVGEIGLGVLRAMKDRCDPAGIMNPGKLSMSTACSGASSGICSPAVASARPLSLSPLTL